MKNCFEGLKLAVLPVMLCVLGACQTTNSAAMNDGIQEDHTCFTFLPISWSQHDTKQTREQVLEHNSVWLELCE